MSPFSTHPPPQSGARILLVPESIATIAACLVACSHPESSRAAATISGPGKDRILWCGFCGAMATDEGQGIRWQSPAVTMLLSRARFEETSRLLHALVESSALAGPARDRLVRDLARLDHAIAHMTAPLGFPLGS